MIKRDELADPNSCLNKNTNDETILFVLKDTDEAMAGTIRFWIGERIKLGLNKPGDKKLLTAERTADEVCVKLNQSK